jgi:hypothetical protein
MAKIRRVTYFMANLEDKPGELLKIMQDLKVQKIGLKGFWGFGTHSGKAQLFVLAKKVEKLRKFWQESGLLAEEGTGFLIRGDDKTGAMIESLQALADAGLNIHAIDAIAAKGSYASFVWVQREDVEKAAEALGV